MRFESLADFAIYLDGLGQFRMQPGLERIAAVLARLGLQTLPCPVVQIIGTNGKGSTAAFLAALGAAHGVTTGLYTSPHFLDPRERIRILEPGEASADCISGSRMVEDRAWLDAANRVLDAGGEELTYFELLTAMAACAFQQAGTGLVVLEAGLGGRFDATTAFKRDMVLFTPISLDHQSVLGNSVEQIARDKAGALTAHGGAGQTALTGPQHPEALQALEETAAETGIPLLRGEEVFTQTGLSIPLTDLALAGSHQRDNARLALAAFFLISRKPNFPLTSMTPENCRTGLRRARLPGRMQRVPAVPGLHPEFILDAAHNPDGLRALARSLKEMEIAPQALIFTCLADKELEEMAPLVQDIIHNLTQCLILVPEMPDNPRARPAAQVAAVLGPNARRAENMRGALAALSHVQGPALLCGSLYLLAEFYKLRPDCLGEGYAATL